MAKKTKETKAETKIEEPQEQKQAEAGMPNLPPELQEKLKEIKEKLETFQKKITEKFDKYIMGVALLPPPKPAEGEAQSKEIHVLVLVDDTDSQKMSKEELRDKLGKIIESMAKETDPNITPQTVILSELWQSCFDGKSELTQMIAMSAPIFDLGMLSAVKIAEIHKSMVLKKFEKYIVSYVLAGSLVQGKATHSSDIDVWIVIDDTDVKRMTRAELKDKLRAIIIGMGIEAGEMTGIKNKLNIQVYILTDFWDSLREANPIIFTLLRDGVPFYDRGTFMPWKQLLRMGKIKPSAEAIDMFMSTGEQMIKRIQFKINEIGMEDTFYALLTPSQAALMLYGIAPPTPRETPELMREIFVQKEKLLEEKYIKILENNIKIRKDLEHGTKKNVTGAEIDTLLKDADDYLKRIRKLFEEIEKIREQESVLQIYETIVTIMRDILRLECVAKVKDNELVDCFESDLVHTGKMPATIMRSIKTIVKAKKDYDDKKLSKPEVEKVKKEAGSLIKFLIEHVQRKRGRELERAKIRVKHGNKYGEVILLDKEAFIIHDIDSEQKEVSRAALNDNGSLGSTFASSMEELEKAIAKIEIPPKTFIKEPIFENLKSIFGKDLEILMNY